ncbi:MAG: hypothetical protein FWC70_00320 [Defluviitaleaceae bacterium]|nr:hypothetical protein [Defluviitaleaceae bacterium]
MATKSMIKSVNIKNKRLAEGLVSALENAEKKSSKEVVLQRRLDEVKGENIKRYFGVQ